MKIFNIIYIYYLLLPANNEKQKEFLILDMDK